MTTDQIKPMTTKQLVPVAERILAHLQRFEADPAINVPHDHDGTYKPNGYLFYYKPTCRAYRKRIKVNYVSYQFELDMSPTEALAYLEKLDAGEVGKHVHLLG